MALVPISNVALAWAVDRSGISIDNLNRRLRADGGTVESWIAGESQPNVTQFKQLKSVLKRPAAVFFMNSPPESTDSTVSMRFALGARSINRSPQEREAIRDSVRVGKFVGGILDDLGLSSGDPPSASTNEDPEVVAEKVRSDFLNVPFDEQLALSSFSSVFRYWRVMIEDKGILVFLYSLGENSARGFSLAEAFPPIIGVSTNWHPSVRIYTLFHELGHILTRTSSSCVEDTGNEQTTDPTERWCESFAAAYLMPREEIEILMRKRNSDDPISTATWLANQLSVSRKSALLRLIDIKMAEWSDFQWLESRFERKNRGGSVDPDHPRTRDVVKKDAYGSCLESVHQAYTKGLVNESDIRTYLGMLPNELT